VSAAGDEPWKQLDRIASDLARVSVAVAREVVTMPNAADLVARTLQVVGLLGSLAVGTREAVAQREADELRALIQVKSDFLRLTTHELRRPLGLLSGYLSMIGEGAYGDVSEKLRASLQQVEAGAVEMAILVDGLASIARLEGRANALHRRPTRIGHLVSDAVEAVMPEATAKNIGMERQLPEPDILAHIDRDLLRVAVVNMLGNAVKYAPAETVVRILVSESDADLTVAVSDQGPGIDPAEAERIFDRWHRAPDATAPGLGLYIVRQVVALHGGHVVVESTPGEGSRFKVVLPVRRDLPP
jgi:signal transduction histidine kinase